jgi:hypothetical protein
MNVNGRLARAVFSLLSCLGLLRSLNRGSQPKIPLHVILDQISQEPKNNKTDPAKCRLIGWVQRRSYLVATSLQDPNDSQAT